MRRVGFVIAAMVLVVAGSCQYPNWEGDPNSRHVAVFGNSITAQAEPEIRAALGDYYRSVSAECGADSGAVASWAPNYNSWSAEGGVVVVNAGTNDWPRNDVGWTLSNIDRIRAHFTGECFVVATLSTHTPDPALNEFAAWVDFYLVFSGDYPNILDFDAFAAAYPWLFYDGVHLREGLGRQMYANLIRQAVQDCR